MLIIGTTGALVQVNAKTLELVSLTSLQGKPNKLLLLPSYYSLVLLVVYHCCQH